MIEPWVITPCDLVIESFDGLYGFYVNVSI